MQHLHFTTAIDDILTHVLVDMVLRPLADMAGEPEVPHVGVVDGDPQIHHKLLLIALHFKARYGHYNAYLLLAFSRSYRETKTRPAGGLKAIKYCQMYEKSWICSPGKLMTEEFSLPLLPATPSTRLMHCFGTKENQGHREVC